jgi:hypothetical protein
MMSAALCDNRDRVISTMFHLPISVEGTGKACANLGLMRNMPEYADFDAIAMADMN